MALDLCLTSRGQGWLAITGLLGCALALLIGGVDPAAGLSAWLVTLLFYSSLPVGAFLLLLMMRIIPGQWRRQLYGPAQLLTLLLPLAAAVAVPLLVGYGGFYAHVKAAREAASEAAFRNLYFLPSLLVLRTAGFFMILGLMALPLLRAGTYATRTAIFGLIVLPVLDILIAADWLMALDPHFHASGFGLYLLSIQAVIGLSALILLRLCLPNQAPADSSAVGLLGSLLLTALLLWIYLSFMQYIISWSGNLPPEVDWYRQHGAGGWSLVEDAVFAVPSAVILLLILPRFRRSAISLRGATATILLTKALEFFWLVMPMTGGDTRLVILLIMILLASLGLISVAMLAAARHLAPRLSLVLREEVLE